MPLPGHAVARLTGDSSSPRPSKIGESQLGTFGPLPVRGGSTPVQCCLSLVHAPVTDPCHCCPLVHAGDTLMRLRRIAERLRAGGQHLHGSSVRLCRVTLGRLQPLTGVGGPAPNGVPVPFSELPKPLAYGVKPGIDLPPTGWQWPGLAVHAFQHAGADGRLPPQGSNEDTAA